MLHSHVYAAPQYESIPHTELTCVSRLLHVSSSMRLIRAMIRGRGRPRGTLTAAPHSVSSSGGRARPRRRRRHSMQQPEVARDDLCLTIHTVLHTMRLAELAHLGDEFGVSVARHCGEEMMLELVLHATPEPLREEVARDRVARRQDLRSHPIVLVLVMELFSLPGRHHDAENAATSATETLRRRGEPSQSQSSGRLGLETAGAAPDERLSQSWPSSHLPAARV